MHTQTKAPAWKPDWPIVRERFIDWWNGKGFLVGCWSGVHLRHPHTAIAAPEQPRSLEQQWVDVPWRVEQSRRSAAWSGYPLDTLPVADPWFGPGSLALYLGSPPTWQSDTVWFNPCIADPDNHPPIRFDAENPWWKLQLLLIRGMLDAAAGDYFVGAPDMAENWDALGSLRESQSLLLDMIERPAWVRNRIDEINDAYFQIYDRVYEMLRHQDGMTGWFRTWAPGKVAKVQCDGCSMFSPAMFREFVVPALTRQCDWLDRSLYHLDGSQCLPHLDALLEIESLDAIEWTPDPKVPQGGSPHWYDLYRRILKAGKRVQVLNPAPEEIPPLFDAIGADGVYCLCFFGTEWQADAYARVVDRLR